MYQNTTIDQHYVSRFYLKNFAEVKGKGKKEKVLISFYQFSKNLFKEKIPTKSICAMRFFYGEDGEVEKQLSEKESQWNKAIKEVLQHPNEEFSSEIEDMLKEFGIYQYGKTEAILEYSRQAFSDLLTIGFANVNKHVDRQLVYEIVRDRVEKSLTASAMVEFLSELKSDLRDLEVAIIEFDTKEKLITSDMPVVQINPFSVSTAGLGMVGTVIMYPISDRMLVVIYDAKMYSCLSQYMLNTNEEDVINLNKYQVISAEDRIISKEINDLSKILLNEEVSVIRDEFEIQRKVESSYDGFGTFLAMYSRSLQYYFQLSFLKLPKKIRKIPIDCRTGLKREFQESSRLHLLCSKYRLPQLIKQQNLLSDADIEKRRKGYSELLEFMDDYWKVPKDKRNITPDLMNKLKTVPTKFFKLDRE